MSLFDKLKDTKFKSLKFGNDRPGGGTGREPIIQKPIRDDNPLGMEIIPKQVALENKERISKLLKFTSRGLRFIQNQQNLTQSNTRLESTDIQSSKLRFTSLAFYSPDVTLNQIGRDPLEEGEHYTRFGISPFMDDSLKYTGVVTKNNQFNNRLTKLRKDLGIEFEINEDQRIAKGIKDASNRNSIITDFTSSTRSFLDGLGSAANAITGITDLLGGNSTITNITNKISKFSRAASIFLSPTIDQYQGGPGSRNGAGITTIRRFDYTNNANQTKRLLEIGKNKLPAPLPSNPQRKISLEAEKKVQQLENTPHTQLERINANITGYTYKVSQQNSKSISSGKIRSQNLIKWTRNTGDGVSNALSSFASSANSIKNGKLENIYDDKGIENINSTSDRMPIRFTIIDPFSGNEKEIYSFSAYLNGFKDNSTPSHTEISYIGRSEHFYVYNKFKRNVSFNFQIPCYNLADLRSKHKSLASLYSTTMGKYNNNKLGGILYKLKLGNYLDNEAGIITSISYDVPNDSPWDIDEQLSQNINVSVSFTVIHNRLPQYDSSGYNLFTIGQSFINSNSFKSPSSNPINKYTDIKTLPAKQIQSLSVNKPPLPELTFPTSLSNSPVIPKSSSTGMLQTSQ